MKNIAVFNNSTGVVSVLETLLIGDVHMINASTLEELLQLLKCENIPAEKCVLSHQTASYTSKLWYFKQNGTGSDGRTSGAGPRIPNTPICVREFGA